MIPRGLCTLFASVAAGLLLGRFLRSGDAVAWYAGLGILALALRGARETKS